MKYTKNIRFLVLLSSLTLLLSACPNPQQEQSLTQIQSQISVLSNEMRQSFDKTEEERVASYQKLAEEVRVLQNNQAGASATNDQLVSALVAIEGKLDEYNARMIKLSERLDSTETAVTERMTSLSEQVNDMSRESTINPTPTALPQSPRADRAFYEPSQQQVATPLQAPPLQPEASKLYHAAYTAYVNGDFERAIAGFEKFLNMYPETELADISQFWIAESVFSLGEYETALQEYSSLVEKYPDSDKIPAALFGKADTYLKLDRQIEAISHLKYIVSQYPDSPVAQKAAERLRALGE